MANAKLHIICGNCGCNHMFEHEVSQEIDDDTSESRAVVCIACNNCGTLHYLEDNSKLTDSL